MSDFEAEQVQPTPDDDLPPGITEDTESEELFMPDQDAGVAAEEAAMHITDSP